MRALGANQAGYASTEMAPLPSTASQPAPHSAVERRQLTVLFCDLKGSTELAARLDPEDLGAVMSAYQTATAAVIERFGEYFARYLGDGVLAYFGWPRAHEDDAERAVRAGLELIEAVARLRPHEGVRLQARVGIATGQVAWAIWSARARRGTTRWSAKRRTWPHACRRSPRRRASSSASRRAGSWAACSS
jgi:class 3 adenylate cyclase